MGVKATFDPTVQRIYLHSGETTFDVKIDFYSDAKEDWRYTEGFPKNEFPFEIVGGNPTIPGQSFAISSVTHTIKVFLPLPAGVQVMVVSVVQSSKRTQFASPSIQYELSFTQYLK